MLHSTHISPISFKCDLDFNSGMFANYCQSLIGTVYYFVGTVFAYGQTSSGKTFTMRGDDNDEDAVGIIPLSIKHLYDEIEQVSTSNLSPQFSGAIFANFMGHFAKFHSSAQQQSFQILWHPIC